MYYNLITDRTQADVDAVVRLEKKGWEAMTDSEKTSWCTGMKGAYGKDDLERICTVITGIATELSSAGYLTKLPVGISWQDFSNKQWDVASIPTMAELNAILSGVEALRAAITVSQDTPDIPDTMNRLTWKQANDMETILLNVKASIDGIEQIFCGEIFEGEW